MSKQERNVQITWYGHACFGIDSEDVSIVIDPYDEVPGYALLDLEADRVYCTHGHGDHNAVERVRLSGRETEVSVEEVASFHDDQEGKLRGPNTIFVFHLGGYKIVHMGDLGHDLDAEEISRLADIDLLMIPVGGHYTIDGDLAAKIVKTLKPRLVIPMHYREGKAAFDVLSTVEPFLSHFTDVATLETEEVPLADLVTDLPGTLVVLPRNPIT